VTEATAFAFGRAARLAGSARPHRARLYFDQARSWLRLDVSDARSRAERLLPRSLHEAESLGMAQLASQAKALLTSAVAFPDDPFDARGRCLRR
jgi:hypothetical protein